jgi:hypothetical protein
VAEGPDPLGKRALYWMQIDEQAEVDDHSGRTADRSTGRGTAQPTPAGRHARAAGKHALYSEATPAGDSVESATTATATATADDPVPQRGVLSVACSSCGSISRVGVMAFVLLQFPFGAWLPGRTFDRWMTCPACRRRTWNSVTLSRWS